MNTFFIRGPLTPGDFLTEVYDLKRPAVIPVVEEPVALRQFDGDPAPVEITDAVSDAPVTKGSIPVKPLTFWQRVWKFLNLS